MGAQRWKRGAMEATDLMLGDGRVGYLEYSEWKKARWAYDYADKFLPWLDIAGYVSFDADVGNVDTSSSVGIGIPATSLTATEIRRIIREIDHWPYLEIAAKDKFGASLMIDLGREMSTAVHRWPMEDKPRKIRELMCGECEQFSLVVKPPRFEGDESIVKCECGYVMTQEEFEQLVDMFEKENIETKRKAVADAKRSRRKSA